MEFMEVGLFGAIEKRLAWLDQRQGLLAQNVANANTPGYKPQDMPAFEAALAGSSLTRTSAQHLLSARTSTGGTQSPAKVRSPDGNAVSIEDQLARIAETSSTQALMLNLHRSYQTMVRTALGRAG